MTPQQIDDLVENGVATDPYTGTVVMELPKEYRARVQ